MLVACEPRLSRSSSGTHAIEVIAIMSRCRSSKWSPLRRAFRKNWKSESPKIKEPVAVGAPRDDGIRLRTYLDLQVVNGFKGVESCVL
jgi:hypothetical protein